MWQLATLNDSVGTYIVWGRSKGQYRVFGVGELFGGGGGARRAERSVHV